MHTYGAAMIGNDPAAETETNTGAIRFCGIEGIKYLIS
jgi:hypothetical protein